jgi:two-component system chemotaxis sensor kinase CheA
MRNAVDHGIELPVDRVGMGKPETGLIRIELFEDNESLVARVYDDGRGIDAKALKEAACKSGKITAEQKDSLSDEDAIKLLFLPGISTKESVTEVSGRGVGMDVVSHTVTKAGGSVNIQSKPTQGTLVEIKLPIKLAA